jgi:hypothetical protein
MMRALFHLASCDDLILDEEGTLHADVDAAHAAAVSAAREIIGADIQQGTVDLDQSIMILDESGTLLGKVEFATVFRSRRSNGADLLIRAHRYDDAGMPPAVGAIIGTFEAPASEMDNRGAL